MQSYYEINVSKNGQHFFATAERSAVTKAQAYKIYTTLQEKFPESEGYEVDITYWECWGYHMTLKELGGDQ